jgi:hypothetical protein
VLLAPSPAANVLYPCRPFERAFSIFLSVFEVPFVPSAIGPCFNAPPLHVAAPEFSFVVLIQICKVVPSEALEVSIHKVSLIVGSIFPIEPTPAILLSLMEVSNVGGLGPAWLAPSFYSLAMLLIFEPIAFVLGIVDVYKNAIAIGLVLHPGSVINVSICMSHPPLAISLVFPPHALVLRAIRPELNSDPISLPRLLAPLTLEEFAIAHVFVLIDVDPFNAIRDFYLCIAQAEGVYLLRH